MTERKYRNLLSQSDSSENGPKVFGGIDVSHHFPEKWQTDLITTIRQSSKVVMINLDHSTNREEDVRGRLFPTVVAEGNLIVAGTPWIENFYKGPLLEMVREYLDPDAMPFEDLSKAITATTLGEYMRLETHVDLRKIGANLHVKRPASFRGGNLVVSTGTTARTYKEVLSSPRLLVPPEVGTVSLVSVNNNPHTVDQVEKVRREWQVPGTDYPNPDSPGEQERLLDIKAFEVPDINSDFFWVRARIALNFNFADPDNTEDNPEAIKLFSYIHGKQI